MDGQTDKQIMRTDRTEGRKDSQQAGWQANRHKSEQIGRERDQQTGRNRDMQMTDRWTDRH